MGQPKGCIPWNKGKEMGPEFCLKMSLAKRGKPLSAKHKENLRRARKHRVGEKAPNWNGGLIIDRKGYLLQYALNHPNGRIIRGRHIYVLVHRLIAEQTLGRFLKPTEVVHHINGIKADNRNCNLVICQDESYHQLLHKRTRAVENE